MCGDVVFMRGFISHRTILLELSVSLQYGVLLSVRCRMKILSMISFFVQTSSKFYFFIRFYGNSFPLSSFTFVFFFTLCFYNDVICSLDSINFTFLLNISRALDRELEKFVKCLKAVVKTFYVLLFLFLLFWFSSFASNPNGKSKPKCL